VGLAIRYSLVGFLKGPGKFVSLSKCDMSHLSRSTHRKYTVQITNLSYHWSTIDRFFYVE